MLVVGDVVDQERFERLKEQPGVIADALRFRLAVAEAAPQFSEDEFGAGQVVAAQHGAFELRDQQSPRTGLQFPEKIPQPLDRRLTYPGHTGTTPQQRWF